MLRGEDLAMLICCSSLLVVCLPVSSSLFPFLSTVLPCCSSSFPCFLFFFVGHIPVLSVSWLLFFPSVMPFFFCSPVVPRRSMPRKHNSPLKTSISPKSRKQYAHIIYLLYPKMIFARTWHSPGKDIWPKETSPGKSYLLVNKKSLKITIVGPWYLPDKRYFRKRRWLCLKRKETLP